MREENKRLIQKKTWTEYSSVYEKDKRVEVKRLVEDRDTWRKITHQLLVGKDGIYRNV